MNNFVETLSVKVLFCFASLGLHFLTKPSPSQQRQPASHLSDDSQSLCTSCCSYLSYAYIGNHSEQQLFYGGDSTPTSRRIFRTGCSDVDGASCSELLDRLLVRLLLVVRQVGGFPNTCLLPVLLFRSFLCVVDVGFAWTCRWCMAYEV